MISAKKRREKQELKGLKEKACRGFYFCFSGGGKRGKRVHEKQCSARERKTIGFRWGGAIGSKEGKISLKRGGKDCPQLKRSTHPGARISVKGGDTDISRKKGEGNGEDFQTPASGRPTQNPDTAVRTKAW